MIGLSVIRVKNTKWSMQMYMLTIHWPMQDVAVVLKKNIKYLRKKQHVVFIKDIKRSCSKSYQRPERKWGLCRPRYCKLFLDWFSGILWQHVASLFQIFNIWRSLTRVNVHVVPNTQCFLWDDVLDDLCEDVKKWHVRVVSCFAW
jgi:hypothetical protein